IAVRDRQGNLIADVKRNIWHVYPPFASDKNYTSDALEVLDARGRVALQLQLLTNGVRLGIETYDEEGGSFRGATGNPSVPSDPTFHRNDAVMPWFEYRSSDHWQDKTDIGKTITNQ